MPISGDPSTHSSDSFAPNDTHPVTLSGAASEAAESKGPPRVRSSPFLQRRTELRGILRLAPLAQNDRFL
jgi:hypothetical protein